MKLGFTGTRYGLSSKQIESILKLLPTLKPTEVHHGDCRGADCDFVNLTHAYDLLAPEIKVIAYPGKSSSGSEEERGYSPFNTEVHLVEHYFSRNQKIVNNSDLLIACPYEMQRQASGGTWYTIFYAEKVNKPLTLIWRDGRVEKFYQEEVK